jgi:hypothetical protein
MWTWEGAAIAEAWFSAEWYISSEGQVDCLALSVCWLLKIVLLLTLQCVCHADYLQWLR